MRAERKFGAEHRLALQTRPLADEQMVVVVLQRLLVHVEDLAAQVEAQAAVGPAQEARIRVLHRLALVVDVLAPADGVADLQLQALPAFLVQRLLLVDFVLVRVGVERARVHR